MNFSFSEDQTLLRNSVRAALDEQCKPAHVRAMMEDGGAGYSESLWAEMAKLGWLNQQYLKSDDPEAVAKHLVWHLEQAGYDLANGPKPADIVIALRERAQTLKEMAEKAAVWFGPLTVYDEASVSKHLKETAREPLTQMRARLAELSDWSPDPIHDVVKVVSDALGIGMGKIAQPLRVAITGTQVSPDIGWTVYLCGRGEALARIDTALAKIALAP